MNAAIQTSPVCRNAGGTGAWGEEVAARYLARKGLRVLARNWRRPGDRRDELDLVCRDRELLVFVEVKTRRAGGLVRGMMAVNLRKMQVLKRSIRAYLDGFPPAHRPLYYRFDVVEIEYGPGRSLGPDSVLHVENYPLFRSRWV